MDGAAAKPDEPRFKEQISFVCGEFASNFAWNMVTGYLLFYYSDVALLPVGSLGTLMLVSRVLDALADPLVGIAVDKTSTRWGKARPYLLFMPIPFAILFVLTFAVPDTTPGLKLAYAYATFTLLGLLYALLYVPYCAIQPMLTANRSIHVRLGSMRAASTSLASIVIYSLVLPVVGLAGADHKSRGFVMAAAIFSSISVLLYFTVFSQCRERFGLKAKGERSISMLEGLGAMVRNPIWLTTFIFMMASFIRLGAVVSVNAYFAKNVLHKPWMLGVMLPLQSASIFTGGVIASQVLKRFRTSRVNAVSLSSAIALTLVLPHLEDIPPVFLGVFALINVSGGINAATLFLNSSRAVEYQEKRFGVRNEGLLVSSISFGQKAGIALGAAIAAWGLAYAGYDPNSSSPEVESVVRLIYYYFPASMIFIQLCCALFGSLDGEKEERGAA